MGSRPLTPGHIETVDEIDKLAVLEALEQGAGRLLQIVPPHVGHLVGMCTGHETHHLFVENTQAVHIALGRMAAHQLLADADAQHWLCERTNHLVQTMLAQIAHGIAGLALSGKNHTVSMT